MTALSIGAAWDEAKAVFEADRKRIVPVALFLILLPAALMTMLTGADQAGKVEQMPPWVAFVVLLILLVTLVGQLTIARLALVPSESVGEAMGVAAKRAFSVLGAAALVFLPLLVVLILVGGGPGETAKLTGVNAVAALLAMGVILYVGIRMSLTSSVAVGEGGGPLTLIKRSFALTRGNVMRILAFVILLLATALLLSWAVGVVAGLLLAFGNGAVEPMSLQALLLGLVQGAIEAGLVITFVLMLTSLYRQATARAVA